MRLEPRFRTTLYATIVVLFGTGAAWFVIDRLKDATSSGGALQTMSTYLLMLHGGAAMLFLLLLGALFALHVQTSWLLKKNRASGAMMLALNVALIATAFGLYYVGSDTFRRWISDIHIAVGLGLPILLVLHVLLGRRSLRAAQRDAAAPNTCRCTDDNR